MIVVEMTPVHAHSDNSHTTVARDFFNIGYYTHVSDDISIFDQIWDATTFGTWLLVQQHVIGNPNSEDKKLGVG